MAKEHFIVSEIDGTWIVAMPDGTEVPCPDRTHAMLCAVRAASVSGEHGNQAQVLTWDQNENLCPIWISGRDFLSYLTPSYGRSSA